MKVLIPVDDMPYTLASLYSVSRRKWPAGTSVTLCRVMEDYSESDIDYHREKTERWLTELADTLDIEGCKIDTAILKGDIVKSIADLANDYSVDYIVIGSHDRSGAERAWLGSVASGVTERVSCSVEIVRPPELHRLMMDENFKRDQVEGIDFTPHRILLALDFSENSLSALKWLAKIGCPATTKLAMIVVDPPLGKGIIDLKLSRGTHGDHTSIPSQEELLRRLRQHADYLSSKIKVQITDTRVLKGLPARTIVDNADSWGADLIVMGAHGVTRSVDSAVGSVTREVMDTSSCSVVAVNSSHWQELGFEWKEA